MKRYVKATNDILNTFGTQALLTEYVGEDTWIKFQDIYGYYMYIQPIEVSDRGSIVYSYVYEKPDYRGEYPYAFYCRASNLEFSHDFTVCYPVTTMTTSEITSKFGVVDTYPR